MLCNKCQAKLQKNGKTSAGNQRWRCPNCGISQTEKLAEIYISDRTLAAIRSLPQIQTLTKHDGWTEGYLIDQVLRNHLQIDSDYDFSDLMVVFSGGIIV